MFEKMKLFFIFLLALSLEGKAQNPCTSSLPPIVFVHGFLGSGDTWTNQINRFSHNGYCKDKLFVFDWNSLGFGNNHTDSLLERFIDSILIKTAASHVELIGHSAGGGTCYKYLKDSLHANKVSHYVQIGSGSLSKPAGPQGRIPTMVVLSKDDMVIRTSKESPGSENVILNGKDHLEVATCEETFTALFGFFNKGKQPTSNETSSKNKVMISGKVLLLGENNPLKQQTVYAYYFDPKTGKRKNKKSDFTLITDNDGRWPAFEADSKEYIEYVINPKEGKTLFYFTEPSSTDNLNVYLRCLPDEGMAAKMLQSIPNDDHQSVIAIFSANKAIIAGRDSLAIDSIPLSTKALMPASSTTIAAFLFDDGDGLSSNHSMKNFGAGVFMNGIDILIPANKNQYSTIYFNGRKMAIPKRPSSEGVMIAVFE